MSIEGRKSGAGPIRSRIEGTFGAALFVANALFYVSGTIAMFLQAPTLAA